MFILEDYLFSMFVPFLKKKLPIYVVSALFVFLGIALLYDSDLFQNEEFSVLAEGSDPVGTIEGNFSITPNGAASYQIAIEVPPGTNGVNPNLSISYNSQGQNGYLGQGFALGGLSSISRCGYYENYDSSNFKRIGVTFSNSDHFCLDGDELLVTNGGVYGADGTEYRTVNDTWTKVISHSSCAAGPCTFTAYNKDGSKMDFGTNSNSQIVAQGRSDGVVRTWALSRFTDLDSNYTDIIYSSDVANGEYYPVAINYTGNSVTGQEPQRKVEFNYEDRTDVVTGYLSGSLITTSKRLKNIKTYVGSDLVLSYKLSYIYSETTDTYSSVTGRSLLRSIKKCDAEDICLPETSFDWQESDSVSGFGNGLTTKTSNSSSLLTVLTADITGDGTDDVVQIQDVDGYFTPTTYISNDDGTFQSGVTQSSTVTSEYMDGYTGVFSADINGDGKQDIVQAVDAGILALISYVSDGTGHFEIYATNTDHLASSRMISPADVNGDGLVDVVQVWVDPETNKAVITSYLSTDDGTGEFSSVGIDTQTNSTDPNYIFIFVAGDVNGDGNADIVEITETSGTDLVLTSYLSNGDGTFQSGVSSNFPYLSNFFPPINVADFNGDGKSDVIIMPIDTSNTLVMNAYLSEGDGSFALVVTDTNNSNNNDGLLIGDTNGDGMADVVELSSDGTHLGELFYLAEGGGTFQNSAFYSISDKTKNSLSVSLADVNGDGKADVVQTINDDGKFTINAYQSMGKPIDLLVGITNGIGGNTQIDYTLMTDSKVYKKNTADSAYPLRNLQTAMNLVSKHSVCDGSVTCDGTTPSGHQYIYNYEYAEAQYDLQRAEWLGFKSFKTYDAQNDRYTISTYNQNYPYNGTLAKSEVCADTEVSGSLECSDGEGSLMSMTETHYADISSSPDQALGIHQIVPTDKIMALYSLGSTDVASRLGKEFHYDEYGNLSVIADLGVVDADNVSISDPDNYPLYTCTIYQNDLSNWRLGYVLQQKLTENMAVCELFLEGADDLDAIVWDPFDDISWSKNSYDSRMNVISQSDYDDINAVFLTSYTSYDSYGNVVGVISPSGTANDETDTSCTDNPTQSCITYDSTYHSFPIQISSPENNSGDRLTSWRSFEPAFGNLLYSTSSNGIESGDESSTTYHDYDGFGRVINSYGPNPAGEKTLLTSTSYKSNGSGFYVATIYLPEWDSTNQALWYWQEAYYDGMSREYLQRSSGINGGENDPIVVATNFDAQGNVDGKTATYFQSTNPDNSLPDGWENINCGSGATNTLGWAKANYNIYTQPECNTGPDGVQQKIVYSYEASGNINLLKNTKIQAFDTTAEVSETTYLNPQQMITKKTAPNGDVLYYKYDQRGLLIATTLNAPYDPSSSCTDLAKGTVCFAYDSLGRKIAELSTDKGRETFVYDKKGRLSEVRYDEGGRISSNDNNDNIIEYLAYDNLDRVLTKKQTSYSDFQGLTQIQTDNFVYDSYSGSVNSKSNLAYMEGRDKNDNLIYSYVLSYDNYSHLVENLAQIPNFSESQSIVYSKSYDPMGRSDTYTYPDGSQQKFIFEIDGTLQETQLCDVATGADCSSSSDFKTYVAYSNYDAASNPLNVAYSNSSGTNILNTVNQYYPSQGGTDSEGEYTGPAYSLKSTTTTSTNTSNPDLFSEVYIWNKANQITNYENTENKQSFGYNGQEGNEGMGFLTDADGDYGTEEYAYDNVGNVISKVSGETTVNYTYNSNTNQLASGSDNSSYQYYITGHLRQKSQGSDNWQYSYNAEGRLIEVYQPEEGIDQLYYYDGFGNNIYTLKKTADTLSATYNLAPNYEIDDLGDGQFMNTKYVTGLGGVVAAITNQDSGINDAVTTALAYPDLLSLSKYLILGLSFLLFVFLFSRILCNKKTEFVADHRKLSLVIPFITVIFLLSNISPAYADLTAGINGAGYPTVGTTRFFVKNHVGTIVVVTDDNGLETANLNYLPFGAIDQNNSMGTDDFRPKFLQNQWNSNSQLYDYGDRFYDPDLGRFISPDIATQYSSPYIYAGNNPINYIDGDGDFAFIILAAIVIAGSYAGGAAVNNGKINPASWNWNSGMTYAGMFGGAALATANVAAAAYIGATYGVAAGVAATTVLGGGENAAYTAMGGGSTKDIGIAAVQGATIALAFEAGGAALGTVYRSFAKRGAAIGAEEVGESLGNKIGGCSFVAGTMVETELGIKKIEEVSAHEKILGYNFAKEKGGFYEVKQTHNRDVNEIISIETAKGDKIQVTPEHPFWVSKQQSWVAAGKLTNQDQLTDYKQNLVDITSIEKIHHSQAVKVYNFTVEETENYYVSDSKILSHNCPWKKGKFDDYIAKSSARNFKQDWETAAGKRSIKAALRQPKGYHEWLPVSQAPKIKQWIDLGEFTISEYRTGMRTLTKDVKFQKGTELGKHGGRFSTQAHNEIISLMESSTNFAQFKQSLNAWANGTKTGYAISIPGGSRNLPRFLQ